MKAVFLQAQPLKGLEGCVWPDHDLCQNYSVLNICISKVHLNGCSMAANWCEFVCMLQKMLA